MYTLYKHTAPNGKVYIGITSRKPESRWEGGKGYKSNVHFYKAIVLYGWDNIKHDILAEGLSKSEAEELEIATIKEYDATNPDKGYNLREGGSLASFSEESLTKMRNSHLGKRLPQEQKNKISIAMKGRKVSKGTFGCKYSAEARAKMSKARVGKKMSEDTKKKVSISRKGKCTGGRNAKARKVKNLDTGETFDSISLACAKYAIDHSNIVMACKSQRRKAGGYAWAYVDTGTR
jgi:group I intron endonuclease